MRGVPSNVKFTKFETVTVDGDSKTVRLLRTQGFKATRSGNRIKVRIPVEGIYRKKIGRGKWATYKWHLSEDEKVKAKQRINTIAHAWRGDLKIGPFKNV